MLRSQRQPSLAAKSHERGRASLLSSPVAASSSLCARAWSRAQLGSVRRRTWHEHSLGFGLLGRLWSVPASLPGVWCRLGLPYNASSRCSLQCGKHEARASAGTAPPCGRKTASHAQTDGLATVHVDSMCCEVNVNRDSLMSVHDREMACLRSSPSTASSPLGAHAWSMPEHSQGRLDTGHAAFAVGEKSELAYTKRNRQVGWQNCAQSCIICRFAVRIVISPCPVLKRAGRERATSPRRFKSTAWTTLANKEAKTVKRKARRLESKP